MNVFWYHFWHSKQTFSRKSQQDTIILQLLTIFLKYGLHSNSSLFQHKYFTPYTNLYTLQDKSTFFRCVTFTNAEMGTQQSYNLRVKYPTFYSTRTSVLRYNNWLVVVLQTYVPGSLLTKKLNSSRLHNKYTNTKSANDARRLHYARKNIVYRIQAISQPHQSPNYLF